MKTKQILLAIVAVCVIASVLAIQSCKKADDTTTKTTTTTTTPPAGITIPKQERSLIMDFSATWCEYCGTWGCPEFDYSAKAHAANVVAMSVHFSTGEGYPFTNLNCAIATALEQQFTCDGPPEYYEGNTVAVDGCYQGSSTTTDPYPTPFDSTLLDQYNYAAMIATTIAQTPVANTGMSTSISGNTLTINTSTEFFTAATGNYYLAVYVLEDGIIATQNVWSNGQTVAHANYVENHVLRGEATSNTAFGESIASGSISSGKTINKTYTMTISSSWSAKNLSVATVIWNDVSGTYNYVNSNISSNTANSN